MDPAARAITCEVCEVTFTRLNNLKRHQRQHHCELGVPSTAGVKRPSSSSPTVEEVPVKRARAALVHLVRCDVCSIDIPTAAYALHLRSNAHKSNSIRDVEDGVQIVSSAFKSRIVTFRVLSTTTESNINLFLRGQKERFQRLVGDRLVVHLTMKINCQLFGVYAKMDASHVITDVKSFNTKNVIVNSTRDLGEVYDSLAEIMSAKSDEFQERDSGWSLQKVLHLEININKYQPMRGSAYIKLPEWIKQKRACVNVKNVDSACFAWAIVSALYPQDQNSHRTSRYPHYTQVLNLEGINFPIEMDDISKFERTNEVSVNVFGVEGKSIVGPLHFTERKRARHVNLLFLQDGKQSHYCWIKDLSRLVGKQLSREKVSKWICDGCLIYFRSEEQLRKHSELDCNHVATTMPTTDNNILEFGNIHKQMKVPFVIYADFESVLKPITTNDDAPLSSTESVHCHEPYSFAYYIKCSYDDSLNKFELYRGPDAAKVFMDKVKEDARRLGKILRVKVPMLQRNSLKVLAFCDAVDCGICGKPLGDDRVRDHDHLTGKYRFDAHSQCNIKYKVPNFIPVVFHNLSGYDSHFIIKELACDKERVTVIPNNKERFISFTKYVKLSEGEPDFDGFDEDGTDVADKSCIQLRFIDSLRFTSSSLDKLVKNLDSDQFCEVRRYFPDEKYSSLLTRKGVFPYKYITDASVLNETSLPTKDAFFNDLTSTNISDDEYEHAQNVWTTFNILILGEYSDLYLKTDVLLLTDVFENFRNVCIRTYNLDPCQYVTAPSLSWDAMMKYTGVKIELLTDVDMHHFIKRGIRGGLVQCSTRYAKANNKYMEDYDAAKPSKYLAYLDANNLYGWAMSQYLPLSGFRWLDADELNLLQERIMDIPEDSAIGYMLEVDLEYPPSIHDTHNDLPFCPENSVPPLPTSKTPKLLATLYDKINYILHYKNLQQCIRNGLKLKAIHRVLEFNQSAWLKSYIDLNTHHRTLAKNTFEKDFFKLMNNSIFGKTMENVDKRVDVKIVTRWEQDGKKLCASTLIARPNFNSCIVLGENLVVIQMDRVKVKYDKPIYVGLSVLDLSKTLMYEFHYSVMRPMYGAKLSLLYMDTDSLAYSVETDDFYSDIRTILDNFDTSNYPPDNRYNIPLVNKKVIGKFKDEFNSDLVLEFIGSRAKSYCLISEKDVIKKIKGISRSVVNKEISVDDFKEVVLSDGDPLVHTMMCIRSHKHQLYTQLVNKISLSGDDDKRCIVPGSTSTYAWGHKNIQFE